MRRGTHGGAAGKYLPGGGFEPPTFGLQNRCKGPTRTASRRQCAPKTPADLLFLQRTAARSRWSADTRRHEHRAPGSAIRRGLDKAIAAERAEAGLPSVPGWTFHDFRRSGVTWLAENGTPPHVADKLLNHVSGTIRGVAAVYQRGEFAEERRRALDAWAAHVLLCA